MRCEEARERLAETLEGAPTAALASHLDGCAACRLEADELRTTWEALGRLPEERPSPALRHRFEAMLAAARAAEAVAGPGPLARLAAFVDGLWPRRPVARFAYSLGVLACGAMLGLGMDRPGAPGEPQDEMTELRGEVQSLSRLVALSMMRQESASERLQGVRYGRLAAGAGDQDDQVIGALVEAVGSDPNVNVRLAAIDALAPAVGRPEISGRLVATFDRQDSPLVQIALADALLDAGQPEARQALVSLASAESLDPTVADHLRLRLGGEL